MFHNLNWSNRQQFVQNNDRNVTDYICTYIIENPKAIT